MYNCIKQLPPILTQSMPENIYHLIETLDPSHEHIFLIGFACDAGAFHCDSRTGSEKAPDCLRDIMKTVTMKPMPAHFEIHDCGNITQGEDFRMALYELQETIKVITTSKIRSVVIVVGGSDDLGAAVARGASGCEHLLRLDSALDAGSAFRKQAFKDGPVVVHELHHKSHLKVIVQDS